MNAPVKDKAELLLRLRKNASIFNSFGVLKIGVFGSFARDEATDSSDVDFLIEFIPEKKTFDNFIDLAFSLEELLGRKVEIITPSSLSKFIGPQILQEVEYVSFAA